MPGLDLGRIYRADADGDGDVDFFDIDPLVALLGTIYPCDSKESMMMGMTGNDDGEPVNAGTPAAALNDNISDQNRATLLAGVETLAQNLPAGSPIDWPAVCETLTEF